MRTEIPKREIVSGMNSRYPLCAGLPTPHHYRPKVSKVAPNPRLSTPHLHPSAVSDTTDWSARPTCRGPPLTTDDCRLTTDNLPHPNPSAFIRPYLRSSAFFPEASLPLKPQSAPKLVHLSDNFRCFGNLVPETCPIQIHLRLSVLICVQVYCFILQPSILNGW